MAAIRAAAATWVRPLTGVWFILYTLVGAGLGIPVGAVLILALIVGLFWLAAS